MGRVPHGHPGDYQITSGYSQEYPGYPQTMLDYPDYLWLLLWMF